jgi:hypothetical protein
MSNNPFVEDWRQCLYAHYAYVVHLQDKENEQSLYHVLTRAGVAEETLWALQESLGINAQSTQEEYSTEAAPSVAAVDDAEKTMTPANPLQEQQALADLHAQLATLVDESALTEGPQTPEDPPIIAMPDVFEGLITSAELQAEAPINTPTLFDILPEESEPLVAPKRKAAKKKTRKEEKSPEKASDESDDASQMTLF